MLILFIIFINYWKVGWKQECANEISLKEEETILQDELEMERNWF